MIDGPTTDGDLMHVVRDDGPDMFVMTAGELERFLMMARRGDQVADVLADVASRASLIRN